MVTSAFDDLGPWPEAPQPPEAPPEPSDNMPAWVRSLLTEAEQQQSAKLRWKIMLRELDLDGPTKAILLWLWERMYGTKVTAFPSRALLAADSGYSLRQVGKVLQWAQQADLIAIKHQRRDTGWKHAGAQRPSVYVLTWPQQRPRCRCHQGARGAL